MQRLSNKVSGQLIQEIFPEDFTSSLTSLVGSLKQLIKEPRPATSAFITSLTSLHKQTEVLEAQYEKQNDEWNMSNAQRACVENVFATQTKSDTIFANVRSSFASDGVEDELMDKCEAMRESTAKILVRVGDSFRLGKQETLAALFQAFDNDAGGMPDYGSWEVGFKGRTFRSFETHCQSTILSHDVELKLRGLIAKYEEDLGSHRLFP